MVSRDEDRLRGKAESEVTFHHVVDRANHEADTNEQRQNPTLQEDGPSKTCRIQASLRKAWNLIWRWRIDSVNYSGLQLFYDFAARAPKVYGRWISSPIPERRTWIAPRRWRCGCGLARSMNSWASSISLAPANSSGGCSKRIGSVSYTHL